MADTKMFWGRSDKNKMFDRDVFVDRYKLVQLAVENNFNYQQLKEYCDSTGEYDFSTVTTVLNIFGLIQFSEGERLEKNIFLDKNFKNEKFLELYLEYYLSYWQVEKDGFIVKPYLLLLKVLKLLKDKNEEPYLTQFEFTEIFKTYRKYDDIDDQLIEDILKNRESVHNNAYGNLGYSSKAYFQFSKLLNFDFNKEKRKKYFFVELNISDSVDKKIDYLLSTNVQNDVFIPKVGNFKTINSAWGKFLNDEKKFNRWFTAMSVIDFKEYCENCENCENGFYFEDSLIRRFILSLKAKPFLIITGISGSGKTKIAELYGEYLEKNARGSLLLLPIGSNWNDNKKLIGFKNPLQADPDKAYQKTQLVEFIEEANANLDKDYIVILDEMNLSYTEKYFADFLSALESRSHAISLPNGQKIKWTSNIKIIGTVNEDETTHTISPKVLDRANVIEMNGLNPLEYINSQLEQNTPLYKVLESNISIDDYKTLLNEIYKSLDGNFAFRVVNEISAYINENKLYDSSQDLDILLDEQIYQKILPKIHGSKLDLPKKLGKLQEVLANTGNPYTLTNRKIEKMLNHVSTHGYASFITG